MQWKLIRLRKERGLHQKDLAKLLNISENAYGMKERGKHQFRQDEMFKLSMFFDLPIEQIFLPTNFGNTEISLEKVTDSEPTTN